MATLNLTNNAGGIIAAVNGSGVNLDGVNTNVIGNITNNFGATIKGGVSAGATDGDGDGVDVDGVVALFNSGDILGLGARGASNNAEGIATGGGSITNYATGRIIGSTLLADAPNGDSTRAGNGILVDDSNGGNAVAATMVDNYGLIQGKSGFGIKIIGTFADTITNRAGGTIHGAGTEAALQTGGGDDQLFNSGSIIGDNGNAIDLGAGNDLLRITGGAASITGNTSGGAGTNTLEVAPGTGNSFAYAGVLSNFETVNIQSGEVTLAGVSTYTGTTVVSGGLLILDGAGRLSTASSLQLDGGTLELANTAGVDAQTFAGLELSDSSVIDLALSALTFSTLGAVAGGETLTVTNWSDSLGYAFRFEGDVTGDAAFLALIAGTTIDGMAAAFHLDGFGFTDVVPVPLPAGAWLLLSGLGMMGALRRRRTAAPA
jgi:autotransporter-associated beta strand protein